MKLKTEFDFKTLNINDLNIVETDFIDIKQKNLKLSCSLINNINSNYQKMLKLFNINKKEIKFLLRNIYYNK